MQRVKEEAEDIKKAFSRWWNQQAIKAQNVGITPGKPQLNPFEELGDAWKQVKAERAAKSTSNPTAVRYNERSLMPQTKTKLEKGQFPDREDGLVYMEQHASNPQEVVMYYADDFGNVTAKRVPRAEYESTVSKMSETDKAVLNRRAELHKSEIDAVRQEREYDRLTGMQRQINEIDQEVEAANRSGRRLSQEEFAAEQKQMAKLQEKRKALSEQVEQGTRDLSRASGTPQSTVTQKIGYSAKGFHW